MITKITKDSIQAWVTMRTMKVGQLAQVCDTSNRESFNMVVLRTGNGIISLTRPATTWTAWDGVSVPDLKVRILPSGAEVTLTQE